MADIPGNTSSTAVFDSDGYMGTYGGDLDGYGDEDWIRVELVANYIVTFSLHLQGPVALDISPILRLYTSTGIPVAVGSNPPGSSNPTIDFSAYATGTYFVAVSSDEDYGNYTVSYSRSTYNDLVLTREADARTGAAYERIFGNEGNDTIFVGDAMEVYGEQGDDRLTGTALGEYISGGTGNDLIDGNGGADTLFGDDGNDYLSGGVSSTLFGGRGDDVLYLNGVGKLFGGEGADQLGGSRGTADILDGGLGNDTYRRVESNDTLVDAGGVDTIIADGSFSLAGYASIENLVSSGGPGLTLTGNALNNRIVASNFGEDTLYGGNAGNDQLEGGFGNDILRAWSGADIFDGGSGHDGIAFEGFTSNVVLNLGSTSAQAISGGSATLISVEDAFGGSGSDTLTGTNGDNTLGGGLGGNDTLNGLGGNDGFRPWSGNDTFNGGDGINDTLDFSPWSAGGSINLQLTTAQAVSGGSLKLSGIENILGGSGNDTFRGADGNSFLAGNNGNDTFIAWSGADTFDGGMGSDTVSFALWSSPVSINLDTATAQAVSGGSVTLSSIENVIGGGGADTFIGVRYLANSFAGNAGADTFRFLTSDDSSALWAIDTITDFDDVAGLAGDRIDLFNIDANSGAGGNEAFAFLAANGTAFGANATGQLRWYTSGGNTFIEGSINADAFAEFTLKLNGTKSLTAEDFIL